MILEEITTSLVNLPEPKTPRSAGVHVSNIIRCIAQESGILKAEWAEELSLVDVRKITDPIAVLRISIGLAWEEWYIPNLPGVCDHPGELEVEGIYMSPDGESLDIFVLSGKKINKLRIHEVKATYKSLNTVVGKTMEDRLNPLSNQWMWLAQIMAYCRGASTMLATLHVLFICGDYSYPISPMLKIWNLQFTKAELDQNWALITEYKSNLIEKGR